MTLHILLNQHMNTKLFSSSLWQNKLSYELNSRKHTQYCIMSILSYAKVHYDKINCHMKMNSIKHTHEENKRKHTHQEILDFLY